MRITFRHGVHPSDNKYITKDLAFEQFAAPQFVEVPLSQHIGAPAAAVVSVGDAVKAGTLIGKANGFVSANVFSSVSGTVTSVIKKRTATGAFCEHIVIENDGKYDCETLPPLDEITASAVKQRVFDAGIVGMGGATFPTHVKLSPKNPVDTLIINAAECEPYITCDYRICLQFAAELMQGVSYLMCALGVDKAYIGVEDNKPLAVSALRESAVPGVEVVPLVTKYPQGGEKQLIYAITGRVVPCGALPAEVGVVVDNVHTAFAVYEAVKLGKPCYGRYMTVSGKGVDFPKNLYVPNGVSYSAIAEYCGQNANAVKIVSGGPMMGFAQADLSVSTGKGSSSLLFLTADEIKGAERDITACINCASCARHCPMNLMPMFIDRAVDVEDASLAKKLNVLNCMECGCCAYVCPANRPLVQSMRRAKRMIKEQGV